MINTAHMLELVAARGPRWAVSATIRPNEHRVDYCLTRDAADARAEQLRGEKHYQIQVHPPEGEVDLARLGQDRADASVVLAERTAVLRAGVLRALEAGDSEVSVARTAGVDRMTVREWAGKSRR
jgi:hypothetical protein